MMNMRPVEARQDRGRADAPDGQPAAATEAAVVAPLRLVGQERPARQVGPGDGVGRGVDARRRAARPDVVRPGGDARRMPGEAVRWLHPRSRRAALGLPTSVERSWLGRRCVLGGRLDGAVGVVIGHPCWKRDAAVRWPCPRGRVAASRRPRASMPERRPYDRPMYAVIMAGGGGTRLWPLSRAARPKPFLPLVGETHRCSRRRWRASPAHRAARRVRRHRRALRGAGARAAARRARRERARGADGPQHGGRGGATPRSPSTGRRTR